MNHPYVLELQTRQKINALTCEGLRNQELKRHKQNAEQWASQQGESLCNQDIAPSPQGVVRRLVGRLRIFTWSVSSRIEIGS